jgi:hypothetical protein
MGMIVEEGMKKEEDDRDRDEYEPVELRRTSLFMGMSFTIL